MNDASQWNDSDNHAGDELIGFKEMRGLTPQETVRRIDLDVPTPVAMVGLMKVMLSQRSQHSTATEPRWLQ